MPKFYVHLTASMTVEVEAADSDTAVSEAFEEVESALDFGTDIRNVSVDYGGVTERAS